MRLSPKTVVAVVIGVLVVSVGAVLAVVTTGDDDDTTPPAARPAATTLATLATTTTTVPPTTVPATPPPSAVVEVPPASALIATLAADVPRYAVPRSEPDGVVAASWLDRPAALAVIEQQPGWLHVRLPQRPNGSTAWIRSTDAVLTTTPYRIQIDVGTMRLRLFDAGELVLDAPAGIGIDAAPTVVGNFFVTFLQVPPDDGNWGPFVMVTSAHSETISDWEESGDAIAAIHGPLDTGDDIGTTGAKVSHGCVRLHLDDLAQLRNVPAGSPVDVIDSAAQPATG